jgi:NADH dehydrogenase
VDPGAARVLLIEAGARLLAAFPEALSDYTRRALEQRGVQVLLDAPVTEIADDHVVVGERRVGAGAVVWAAGVAASAAADWLHADRDRAGRIMVDSDLSVPGHPEIFAIGDTAAARSDAGKPIPGVAPAAKQMGRHVGALIAQRAQGQVGSAPFRYRHQGDLATIGRKAAVVRMDRITLTGFPAWLVWGVVHVYFLIGLRNRIAVAFSWIWDYLTFGRRARLITEPANAAPAEAQRRGPSASPSAPAAATAADAAPSSAGGVWG